MDGQGYVLPFSRGAKAGSLSFAGKKGVHFA
jgi:hypothetical protein